MRYVLIAVGALVLLGAGAACVFAYSRWHASQDIRGSSTEEFNTTEVVR